MWGFKSSILDVTNKCRAFNLGVWKSRNPESGAGAGNGNGTGPEPEPEP